MRPTSSSMIRSDLSHLWGQRHLLGGKSEFQNNKYIQYYFHTIPLLTIVVCWHYDRVDASRYFSSRSLYPSLLDVSSPISTIQDALPCLRYSLYTLNRIRWIRTYRRLCFSNGTGQPVITVTPLPDNKSTECAVMNWNQTSNSWSAASCCTPADGVSWTACQKRETERKLIFFQV